MGNSTIGNPALASRLRKVLRGDVLFGAFDRGRYSTDASIYQIEPIGVLLPKGPEDVEAALALAREEGFPVIARGGGSSQNGQTLGEAVVMDTSRYMNEVLEIDEAAGPTAKPDDLARRLGATADTAGWRALTRIIETVDQAAGGRFQTAFDPTLVRGMSYYTGPIFEIRYRDSASSIAGGGSIAVSRTDVLGTTAPQNLGCRGFAASSS